MTNKFIKKILFKINYIYILVVFRKPLKGPDVLKVIKIVKNIKKLYEKLWTDLEIIKIRISRYIN